jgi:hypothetical protein
MASSSNLGGGRVNVIPAGLRSMIRMGADRNSQVVIKIKSSETAGDLTRSRRFEGCGAILGLFYCARPSISGACAMTTSRTSPGLPRGDCGYRHRGTPERPGFADGGRGRRSGRACAYALWQSLPAFYEFTGTSYPKTKRRFTVTDAPCTAIVGIWRSGGGNQPDAFAMLTIAPGPDVVPIHSRQVVVLRPDNWRAWLVLTLEAPEQSGLFRFGQLSG